MARRICTRWQEASTADGCSADSARWGMMMAAKAPLDPVAPHRGGCACALSRQLVPLHRLPEHRQIGAVGDPRQPRAESGGIDETHAFDEIKICWLGASRKRVEDNRFTGKGNYTDDITLPGMLHIKNCAARWRTARIVSMYASKAWDMPGVHLVLTGDLMATRNLAWTPTLFLDETTRAASLATDKGRFQGQEWGVIAYDPYIAKHACEAIEVEYQPLPVTELGRGGRRGRPRHRDDNYNENSNVILDWQVGDAAGLTGPSSRPRTWRFPSDRTTVVDVADRVLRFDRGLQPGPRPALPWTTTRRCNIIRAAVALVAELPQHMIRIISPDIGGGFGNKVPVYPGDAADPGLDPA